MKILRNDLYYHGVRLLCAAILCAASFEKVRQDFPPMAAVEVAKANLQVTTIYRDDSQITVVPETKENLLFLPSQGLIGCTSPEEATKLAKVFADAGIDPIKSGFAYDTYWNSAGCNVYNEGVTLKPDVAQASFTTLQKAYVKVFLGKEGEVVEPAQFLATVYIVMMNSEVFENIFQCEHDIDEESGFDRIELCRTHV